MCLRLAALFCHGRVDEAPGATLAVNGDAFTLQLSANWLAEHPLTALLLDEEMMRWTKYGVSLTLKAR